MKKGIVRASAIGIIACVSVALTGCFETTSSTNVSPKAVYQDYRLSYDAGTGRLRAFAQFTVGGSLGTSLDLASPSQVAIDGKVLQESNFLGAYYEGDWDEEFGSGAHTWTWVDQAGQTYTNPIGLTPFTVSESPATWSLTGSITIAVSGAPLGAGEQFEAWVSQNNSAGVQTALADLQMLDAGHLSLTLPRQPGQSAFSAGSATVTLSRKKYTPIQQATEGGGSMSSSYSAAPLMIQLAN